MNQSSGTALNVDVVVVGAGPSGLTTAIDLGRRGVRCALLERLPAPSPWPKADRASARTMEFYRRLGLAERIRAVGYPADNPMDVFVVNRLNEPPVARLPFPSVWASRVQTAFAVDGSLPLEPYQLVSQNALEPVLKEAAEVTSNVVVRYGWEVVAVTQDDDTVRVIARSGEGAEHTVTGRYLVAADGGRSTIRCELGIELKGWSGDRDLVQVVFGSERLYGQIAAGRGRHYMFIDGSMLVAQGSRTEFTLHSALPVGSDFGALLRDLIGTDVSFDIRHILTWRHRMALADRYRDRRIFLIGDAAHLVIPAGGLGMNTGIGDGIDLSWKLAAVLHGWGGPRLLDSYESERRPVGAANVEASGWAAGGIQEWREIVDSGATTEQIARSAAELLGRMHTMRGAELGYHYAASPIIPVEPGTPEQWDISKYRPSAHPGARLPHLWLRDGRALHDIAGPGYTLLDLTGGIDADDIDGNNGSTAMAEALRSRGVPVTVLRLSEPGLRAAYQASLLLLRPDLHVAWRGNAPPPDLQSLAAQVTGW
jgi:2-polyprenyl-6-methoxyphenol hydroxylase-like FAD-dependent oxidoreductase